MTKYILFIFSILFSFQSIAQYEYHDSTKNILIVTSVYYGKNAYVQNPLATINPNTYCTDSVFVNGQKWPVIINASAYEINLSSLSTGTPVKILIYHNEFCMPRFLTSGWLAAPSPLTFTYFYINSKGEVHIETINGPRGKRSDLKISQFRGIKWNTVLYIKQKPGIKNYYDTVVTLSPGVNKFRVSDNNATGLHDYSDITVNSGIPPIAYTIDSAMNYITFDDFVYYKLENSEKVIITYGYIKQMNISNLENGTYMMFYENECFPFEINRNKTTDD